MERYFYIAVSNVWSITNIDQLSIGDEGTGRPFVAGKYLLVQPCQIGL